MLRRLILATAILVMLPAAASAGYTYYGPHLGFSSGPDQFVMGGHLQWNGVAPQVAFVPGADIAFGDNFTMVSLNGDFHYQIAGTTKWRPYLGAGVGFHFPQGDNVSNDAVTGGHFIVGAAVPLQTGGRFFTELKLGFDNAPDFKALAGWNFK